MPSSRRSLFTGPSSSRPIGRPPGVRPMGTLSPGIPALLPGSVFWMNVGNVGTRSPFSPVVSSSPIGAAGSGVVGNTSAAMLCFLNASA